MPQGSAPLAFPTWRDHWTSLEGVPTLLAEADAILRRRATGNNQIPPSNHSDGGKALALAIPAMRRWAEGEPPTETAIRPDLARRIHAIVQPVLRVAAWPRWLFLERAFLDGSATGDLLFAALALRTMCEEVQRLHAVDLDADQLADLAASSATEDAERLALFFSVAWTSLGGLPKEMLVDGKDWPSLKLMGAGMPRLEKARRALNSYVHPNYGSHIAALFPDRASAAELLLQAVVAVYGEFFTLSWAEHPVDGGSAPSSIGAFESWPNTVERFQSQTLPELRQSFENLVVAEIMKLPALIEWLTTSRPDIEATLRSPAFVPLVRGLPRRLPGVTEQNGASDYAMWDGASAINVIDLALARHVEKSLSDEFPSGAPQTINQIQWLRFNRLSLELAMLLDDVKAGAFKTQLIRQITQGNSLGALLCVRSLIEHRALAVWLPQAVGISLNDLATKLQAASPLPNNATELDQHLANFLTTQAKGSREDRRPWVIDEAGGVRTAWLNLGNIVEAAFPAEDRFRMIYALASAALHGRTERGTELALGDRQSTLRARSLGLLVLERLCGHEEEMNHLAAAAGLSMQLDHAERFGGTTTATTDVMAQQAFGLINQPLLPDIDYTGEGSADNPFRMAPHLQFHKASYALLKQMGVDICKCPRELDKDSAGHLCDRWKAADRDYWFHLDHVGAGRNLR